MSGRSGNDMIMIMIMIMIMMMVKVMMVRVLTMILRFTEYNEDVMLVVVNMISII